jgi:uncharacterized protein (UPF0335 family)
MRYLKAYENFNYEPTNEEFLGGLFSAQTRNEYIKQGFDKISKLLQTDTTLQAKLEEIYTEAEQSGNLPSQQDVQKLQDIVGGRSEEKVEKLEDAMKEESETVQENKFSSIIEKIKKVLSWVFNFGKQTLWLVGSLASMFFAGSEAMGARVILSGEASGNLSYSWYGLLMLIGGFISLILWVADKHMKISGQGPLFGGKK